SGLAQAGEISGFEQGADLRYSEMLRVLQASHARVAIVAGQPPGFGELGRGALGLAFEGINGGKISVSVREPRIGAARLSKPEDRLLEARLQQVHPTDPLMPT